jgi:hypothetical protein
MNEVDKCCDNALSAGKLAMTTHSDDHHKAAQAAHEQAYAHAKVADRPSLANSHLQMAALHGRHADPTTPEGKSSAAFRATNKARASGRAEDHDAAAQAHEDAGKAQFSGLGAAPNDHGSTAFRHRDQARALRSPPPPRPFD